jgi:aromatic ring-opening dioxygenase catalytic subunit (LigB family)
MADFVGAFAASHAPLIARDWERFPDALRARLTDSYDAVGQRLKAARPDIIVEIAPDHWTNFFIDNLPSVCIGVGAQHDGPREPFMASFAHKTLPGDAAFGRHLLETALATGFEPSASHRMTLDHGFCIPLMKMALDPLPAIVPLVINDLEPPMPSIARCADWGTLVARAIASYPADVRIAVLASGGLSHSIGEPTMGAIDDAFDRRCIAALEAGDTTALVAFLEAALPAMGNGAHEVRNWVVAHAAAGGEGFALIDYYAVPEVYVGCAWAAWDKGASRAE